MQGVATHAHKAANRQNAAKKQIKAINQGNPYKNKGQLYKNKGQLEPSSYI